MQPSSSTEPQTNLHARRVWLECGVFVLLLGLAAALRVPGLFQGFWGDEVYTLCGAMWPLDKLLSGKMAASTFTPLTWLVVKATIALFPPAAQFRFPVQMPVTSEVIPTHLNEATLRFPFFILSLVTLAVLFLMVRKYFGLNVAFWTGLFLAVSPEHIDYSNELRFYGMVCLAGAVLLYGVNLVLDRKGWRGWVVTALGLLLGLPTHLSFFFVTAGIMGGAALSLLLEPLPWRQRMGTIAGLAGLCVAVVVLQVTVTVSFSPAPLDEMRLLFSGQKSVSGENAPDAGADADANATAEKAYERPVQRYRLGLGEYLNTFVVTRFLSCNGLLCGVAFAVVLAAGVAELYFRRRSLLFMLLGVLCSPFPLFFMQVNHKWLHRYFIFDILLCAVLVGVGMNVVFRGLRGLVGQSRPRLGIAACTILAVLLGLVYFPSLAVGMERAVDSHTDGGMKRLSRDLAQSMAPTDRILFLEPYKVRLSYHLIPYYLRRMRPDWHCHGVINKMMLCADSKAFNNTLAKQPADGFWVVSFDDNNKDVSLNKLLQESGARLCGQYSDSSLWRIGGNRPSKGGALAENVLASGPSGVELPSEASDLGQGAYRVALAQNSDAALKTPTLLLPVVRDENDQPSTNLNANLTYTLRFRLQLENIMRGSNRTRMFRVMLFAKETTADLMYAEGTAEGQDYEITFMPGEYLPATLSNVKIGFGIRGGTGAFRVENVTLSAERTSL